MRDGSSLKRIRQWGQTNGLLAALQTDSQIGLTDGRILKNERIRIFGQNIIIQYQKSFWQMIKDCLEDQTIRILCITAVISLIMDILIKGLDIGLINFASLLIILTMNLLVLIGVRLIKDKKIKQIHTVKNWKKVNVCRNGQIKEIFSNQLLVGDIQIIQNGQILVADGFLLEHHRLSVDQSSMTGQPIQIKKSIPTWAAPEEKCNPFLISNTKIMEGNGKMVVLAVGQFSQYGILNKKIYCEEDQSPLQIKLQNLCQKIGKVGFYIMILTFTCLTLHIFYQAYKADNSLSKIFTLETLRQITHTLTIVISLTFILIPEELFLATIIFYAFSASMLHKHNILIKSLYALETIGFLDNICFDKASLLSKKGLVAVKIYVQQKIVDKIISNCMTDSVGELLSIGISLNTTANPKFIQKSGKAKNVNQRIKIECALLEMVDLLGYNYKKIRKQNKLNIIKTISQSYGTKITSTIVYLNNKKYIFSIGSYSCLIQKCSSYLNTQGNIIPINNIYKNTLNTIEKEFIDDDLQIVLIAFRQGQNEDVNTTKQEIQKQLIIIGIVGIKTPIIQQAPYVIKQCQKAGINVKFATNDSLTNAVTFAKEISLIDSDWEKDGEKDYTIITGQDFHKFVVGILIKKNYQQVLIENISNFKMKIEKIKVIAESSYHQYYVALGFKQLNNILGMTSVNSSILKKASIILSTNPQDSQSIKDISQVMLLDGNLTSILTAIKHGRNLFNAVQKILQLHLAIIISTTVIILASATMFGQIPFYPIHIIWINIFINSIAFISIATDSPQQSIMKSKPSVPIKSLISSNMVNQIIFQAIFQIIVLMIILIKGHQILDIQSSIRITEWNNQSGKHFCILFNTFFYLQIFNLINCRKLRLNGTESFKNIFSNATFFVIFMITILVQCLAVEYGGEVFKTTPLSMNQHIMCLFCGAIPLILRFLLALCHDFIILFGKIHQIKPNNQYQMIDEQYIA